MRLNIQCRKQTSTQVKNNIVKCYPIGMYETGTTVRISLGKITLLFFFKIWTWELWKSLLERFKWENGTFSFWILVSKIFECIWKIAIVAF